MDYTSNKDDEQRALSLLENMHFDIITGCWLPEEDVEERRRIRYIFGVEYVCAPLIAKAEYYGGYLSFCLLSKDRCVNPFHCIYLIHDSMRDVRVVVT